MVEEPRIHIAFATGIVWLFGLPPSCSDAAHTATPSII